MNLIDPNPAHADSAPSKITMYGADWCGDCIRAKAFFEKNDVDYDYVDMVEHESATDIVLARNNGVQKIPVIIYPDNTHLVEPNNEALQQKHDEMMDDQSNGTDVEYTIEENRDEGRFELHRNGEILSVADFSERSGGVVVVPHVGTDPQHRGRGNAARLMTGMLDQLRASDRTIDPVCPFAAQFIADNQQYQDLVA